MNHKGTVLLETKRLILRRFQIEDAEAMFRNWASSKEVTRFLRWPAHASLTVTEGVLTQWIQNYAQDSFYQWAIVPKDIGEPIGSISVVEMDEKTKKVHIGYCTGSSWWHQGYTSEAFSGIIPFLFQEVGAGRIEARHDPDNPHSGSVMKKCGLTYEGTLRRADWNNRGIVDACMYGLLAEDYYNSK